MIGYYEFEAIGACAPIPRISWTICRRKRTAEKPGNGGEIGQYIRSTASTRTKTENREIVKRT